MTINGRLRGLIAATFTPMDNEGNINYDVIEQYASYVASSPIEGVFVNGTTGEFSSLTIDERKAILERWIKAAAGRFKVICHVGCNCQRYAVELARHAADVGAYAIGSTAPSFFKPATVKDLVDFFAPVAAAAQELPFYYYNIPSMTGVSLPVDKFLIEGKKVMPNLAGTKFTHNNLMEMGACIALNNGEFEVLHGYDEVLIAGVSMGAVAGIGSTYNYVPEIYAGIFEAMSRNDVEAARVLQRQSIKVVEVILRYGGGVRGGKAIMNLMGIECGECRSPIAPVTTSEYEQLAADLKSLGFVNI